MKIPPIDLSKLVQLLKSEGRAEMTVAAAPKLGTLTRGAKVNNLPLFKEWDNIILIMDREVIPLLKKGCEAKSLLGPAQRLAKSAGALSLMASQVLSFVPGPVGIVCSVVNAIVCFSAGNIIGGLLELLGCIPGGKAAGKAAGKVAEKVGGKIADKGASKLGGKIKDIMVEIVQSNRDLRKIVEAVPRPPEAIAKFFAEHPLKVKPKPQPQVGHGYGVRTPMSAPKTGNMSSLEEALKIKMGREAQTHIPPRGNYYYPESINSMIYRLGTNTGKFKI